LVQLPRTVIRSNALLLFLLPCCALPQGSGKPIGSAHFAQTGGGPSVAAEGNLEFEVDYDRDPGDTLATGIGLVLGLPARNEVSIAWAPYSILRRPGPDARHTGDVSFAWKNQVFKATEQTPAWSLELGTHLATGEAGHLRGEGAADFYFATSAAQSFDGDTVTGYYELSFADVPGSVAARAEHIAAVQWARLLQPRVSGYVEGIGVLGPAADLSGTYLGGGVAWQLHKRFALEAGLLFGLGGDAEDFRLLLGLTTLVAQFGSFGM
jgi:hypothetical protein